MKRVKQQWRTYRELCLPKDMPAEELESRRLAYFAGAAVLFNFIVGGALSEGPGETQGDIQLMGDLQAELDEFGQELDKKTLGFTMADVMRRPQ
jgi:hypothetical protein